MVRAIVTTLGVVFAICCPSAFATETQRGVLTTTIADDFASRESHITYRLRSDGESVTVVPTEPVAATTGDRVEVRGTMKEGRLIGAVTTQSNESGELLLDRPRTLAIVLINYEHLPEEPWTPEEVRNQVLDSGSSFKQFYRDESYGELSFVGKTHPEGDVYGWYSIDASVEEKLCAFGDRTHRIDQELRDNGLDLAAYDHTMYIFKEIPGCPDGGAAQIHGRLSHIRARNDDLTHGVSQSDIVHELGHNLGFYHANRLMCLDATPREVSLSTPGATCKEEEYGDPFDVMGIQFRHHHGWFLAMLGILDPSNIVTVKRPGIYSLTSALHETDQPVVLRIARAWDATGAVTEWLDLEIRENAESGVEKISDPAADRSAAGVSMRLMDTEDPESSLIDSSPDTHLGAGDAPYQPGEVFDDGRIRIETLEAGDGKAKVSIQFDEALMDQMAPTAPVLRSAVEFESGVRLRWSASEDDLGVARYLVFRDGSQIGFTSELTFTDAHTSVGMHAYTIYAEDESGHRSVASAPLTFSILDKTPPTKPSGLSATLNSSGIHLSWKASTDNVAVARYRVYRGGQAIGTTQQTTFTDSTLPVSPHLYSVYAEDLRGNRSASDSLSVADVTPPSAPAALMADLTREGVVLKWKSSTDNVQVSRYLLFRAGKMLDDTTVTEHLDRSPPTGAHAYTVRAEDQAGNLSVPSTPIEVVVHGSTVGTSISEHRIGSNLRLSWRRGRRARLVFLVKDPKLPPGARLELWIDRRLVKASSNPKLKAVWRRPDTGAHLIQARETAGGVQLARETRRIAPTRNPRRLPLACCWPRTALFAEGLGNN